MSFKKCLSKKSLEEEKLDSGTFRLRLRRADRAQWVNFEFGVFASRTKYCSSAEKFLEVDTRGKKPLATTSITQWVRFEVGPGEPSSIYNAAHCQRKWHSCPQNQGRQGRLWFQLELPNEKLKIYSQSRYCCC